MPTPEITPDEAVEALKRSTLPTVITEGLDDYLVFRRIETSLAHFGVSVMPVGGKTSVLEVFRRRDEFKHLKVAYVLDQDMWLFTGVPQDYLNSQVALTDGYSIENDLYRDGNVERYLSQSEKEEFSARCEEVCRWFSFAARQAVNQGSPMLDAHPKQILNSAGVLCPHFVMRCGYTGYCEQLFPAIFADYQRLLRGKTLWHLVLVQLSKHGRPAQHNYRSLMEVAAHSDGPRIIALKNKLALAMA